MAKDFDQEQEIVYSKKIRAGKRRTYFLDVRRTKGEDYYLTLTESTKKFNTDGFIRHKIFLYKEDFNRFIEGLNDVVDHIKTELLPEYDFEKFDRPREEWEISNQSNDETPIDTPDGIDESNKTKPAEPPSIDIDEDLNW